MRWRWPDERIQTEMEEYLEKLSEWKEEERKQLATIAEQLGEKIKAILEVVADKNTSKEEQKEQISWIMKVR